jgi:hypothetical protein
MVLSVREDRADVVYADFEEAFPYKCLIRKLGSFGTHPAILSWMESFLNW